MATMNVNQKMIEMLNHIASKLENIEAEVKEIKGEMGLEVRPEYLTKLKSIRKEKGIPFKNIDELRQMIEK
ncbi:hypothetical protein HYX00_00645 [Candidatus Woesearchaeota archaeon]|nr:hypothetical protein [Candidatus Woesearchaeota archaeon]